MVGLAKQNGPAGATNTPGPGNPDETGVAMNSFTPSASPVKPESAPFRPLLAPPAATYWRDECNALHVLLSGRRKADAYELIPLSTDIGGAAFRWFKPGGESYDVLVNGHDSSCTCAGWSYTGGCKHLQTTHELLASGVLSVAPDSAAECEPDEWAA